MSDDNIRALPEFARRQKALDEQYAEIIRRQNDLNAEIARRRQNEMADDCPECGRKDRHRRDCFIGVCDERDAWKARAEVAEGIIADHRKAAANERAAAIVAERRAESLAVAAEEAVQWFATLAAIPECGFSLEHALREWHVVIPAEFKALDNTATATSDEQRDNLRSGS